MIHGGPALLVPVLAVALSSTPTPRIPLRYDPVLAKGDFPNPAARLTLNGRTAWFLFDTGVGVHMVASWLVEAAGLKVDDAFGEKVSGVDSTGRAIAFRGLRDVSARLDDGSELPLGIAAVADFPPEFRQFEVGGALSPQLLAGHEQAAALDLRVPELRIESFRDSVRRLGARVLSHDRIQLCGSMTDQVPNLVFAIGVSAGARQGMLLVDTGAGVTKVVAQSALVRGARLSAGGLTTGLAGKPQLYQLARGLELTFGGHRAAVDARVIEQTREHCGADGLLGLDGLGRCAVVLSSTAIALACER